MFLRFVAFTTVFLIAKLAAAGVISELPQCLFDFRCRPIALAAERAFESADYEEALRLYQEALTRVSDPRLMRNIGQTFLKLGQPAQALSYFKRSQLTEHDPELTQQLQQDLSEAQAALDRLAQRPVVASTEAETAGAREKRPTWRLVLGSAAIIAGLSGLGFGSYAAAVNGTCWDLSQPVDLCSPYYDTQLPAGLLLGAGAVFSVAGVILLAVPGPRKEGTHAAKALGTNHAFRFRINSLSSVSFGTSLDLKL